MGIRVNQTWRLLKETFKEWNADNASQLAAALAYYTVFALAPLLIVIIAIAGFFLGEDAVRGEIIGQIQGLVGRDSAEFIQDVLRNANQPGDNSDLIASLVSIGLLLVGASSVFIQLQESLNTIWNVRMKPGQGVMGFFRKRLLSFGMLLVIGFLLLVSLVVSAGLAGLASYTNLLLPGWEAFLRLFNFLLSFGIITLLFALIYKFLPDVKITWGDVWIGSAMTALLFTIGKFLIGLYIGNSSFSSTYGAAGSLVVILAWVYYSVQILFFGAEFTQVYARRYGSQIIPDRQAISTIEPDIRHQSKG